MILSNHHTFILFKVLVMSYIFLSLFILFIVSLLPLELISMSTGTLPLFFITVFLIPRMVSGKGLILNICVLNYHKELPSWTLLLMLENRVSEVYCLLKVHSLDLGSITSLPHKLALINSLIAFIITVHNFMFEFTMSNINLLYFCEVEKYFQGSKQGTVILSNKKKCWQVDLDQLSP